MAADSNFMMGDHDNSVSVPFTDDESEQKAAAAKDLDDDDSPTATPEERITRKQKRQARLQQLIQNGQKSQEEAAALREELGTLKGELQQLRGFVAGQAQTRQTQDPGKDPFEEELDAVYEKQRNAYEAAQAEMKNGKWDDSRQRHYEKIARDVEREKARIHTRRELAQQEPQRRAEQGQQRWVQQYPDIYGNQAAYDYAEGTFKRRRAQGEAVTDDLVHEVMKETRATFKLGPKPQPSATERSRLSGLPSSGSGGGSPRSAAVQMTPELRRMAVAAYSHLPEDEAVKAWVNKTGKKLRERKAL